MTRPGAWAGQTRGLLCSRSWAGPARSRAAPVWGRGPWADGGTGTALPPPHPAPLQIRRWGHWGAVTALCCSPPAPHCTGQPAATGLLSANHPSRGLGCQGNRGLQAAGQGGQRPLKATDSAVLGLPGTGLAPWLGQGPGEPPWASEGPGTFDLLVTTQLWGRGPQPQPLGWLQLSIPPNLTNGLGPVPLSGYPLHRGWGTEAQSWPG